MRFVIDAGVHESGAPRDILQRVALATLADLR